MNFQPNAARQVFSRRAKSAAALAAASLTLAPLAASAEDASHTVLSPVGTLQLTPVEQTVQETVVETGQPITHRYYVFPEDYTQGNHQGVAIASDGSQFLTEDNYSNPTQQLFSILVPQGNGTVAGNQYSYPNEYGIPNGLNKRGEATVDYAIDGSNVMAAALVPEPKNPANLVVNNIAENVFPAGISDTQVITGLYGYGINNSIINFVTTVGGKVQTTEQYRIIGGPNNKGQVMSIGADEQGNYSEKGIDICNGYAQKAHECHSTNAQSITQYDPYRIAINDQGDSAGSNIYLGNCGTGVSSSFANAFGKIESPRDSVVCTPKPLIQKVTGDTNMAVLGTAINGMTDEINVNGTKVVGLVGTVSFQDTAQNISGVLPIVDIVISPNTPVSRYGAPGGKVFPYLHQ
jgi:hypothetical protein